MAINNQSISGTDNGMDGDVNRPVSVEVPEGELWYVESLDVYITNDSDGDVGVSAAVGTPEIMNDVQNGFLGDLGRAGGGNPSPGRGVTIPVDSYATGGELVAIETDYYQGDGTVEYTFLIRRVL